MEKDRRERERGREEMTKKENYFAICGTLLCRFLHRKHREAPTKLERLLRPPGGCKVCSLCWPRSQTLGYTTNWELLYGRFNDANGSPVNDSTASGLLHFRFFRLCVFTTIIK